MAQKKKDSPQEQLQEMKCPNCGGPLVYDPEKKTLSCSYCGSQVDLGYWQDNKISGFDFENVENDAILENAEDIPIYNCVSCGAQILAAKEEVSMTCPYCGNNIVLTDRISGKLRPNAIVPFKITPADLPKALKKYYKDKVLLPKNFFNESKLEKITGIYVPFWSFTGDVTGDLSYSASIVNVSRTDDYEYTETKHYRLLRNASVSFQNLLLDASEKMDDAYMDSILPYDLSEACPFQTAYLAGYAADRFDVKSKSMANRAEERMRTSAYNAVLPLASRGGYSNVSLTGGLLAAHMQEVKYLLLPVYVFQVSFHGQSYRFAVNGQTGKAAGTIPIDKKTCKKYRTFSRVIVFAAVMVLGLISYLLGV